jgi:16S rRNA (guanine966-N2)-methyltransferase
LRIISGRFKGRKLLPIKGNAIRPTSDKARESIFNIIGSEIEEKVFLDIFAGTGAMGLEALSRGAKFCVFMDKNSESILSIKKNILICRADKQAQVIRKDCLKEIKMINFSFDIVFIDPPYNINAIPIVLNNLCKSEILQKNALIIAEHSSKWNFSQNIREITLYDKRKYGSASVSFFKYNRKA